MKERSWIRHKTREACSLPEAVSQEVSARGERHEHTDLFANCAAIVPPALSLRSRPLDGALSDSTALAPRLPALFYLAFSFIHNP